MLNYVNGIEINSPITPAIDSDWSYKRLKYLRALNNQLLSLTSNGPVTGSLANLIYSSLISNANREGIHVSNLEDREWLRQTILFWSNMIFDRFGTYAYTYLRYPEDLIVESEQKLRRRSRLHQEQLKEEGQVVYRKTKLSLPFATISITSRDGFSRLFELLGIELQIPFDGLNINTVLAAISTVPSDNILLLANGADLGLLNTAKEIHESNTRRKINILETANEIQGIVAITLSDPNQAFETNMQILTLGIKECKIIKTFFDYEKNSYYSKVNDVLQSAYFKSEIEAYLDAIQNNITFEIKNIDIYEDSSTARKLYSDLEKLYSSVAINLFTDAESAVCLS